MALKRSDTKSKSSSSSSKRNSEKKQIKNDVCPPKRVACGSSASCGLEVQSMLKDGITYISHYCHLRTDLAPPIFVLLLLVAYAY